MYIYIYGAAAVADQGRADGDGHVGERRRPERRVRLAGLAILCYIILYHSISYYIIICHIIRLHYVALYYTMLHYSSF